MRIIPANLFKGAIQHLKGWETLAQAVPKNRVLQHNSSTALFLKLTEASN